MGDEPRIGLMVLSIEKGCRWANNQQPCLKVSVFLLIFIFIWFFRFYFLFFFYFLNVLFFSI